MKRVLSLLPLSLVLLSAVAVEAQEVKSDATTTFQPNSAVIVPIDPEDEEDIVPVHPPTAGPLSINYASDIAFGQHKRKRGEETFYAKEDTVTLVGTGEKRNYPNFVQVTDLRGTASGWSLSVRQNGPLMNEKKEALVGAKLSVSADSIQSQSDMPQVPTGLVKNQVLTDDGTTFHQIVAAEANTGIGTWSVFLGTAGNEASGVSLSVPKDTPQAAGIYTTTLTWSLQDAL